MASSKVTFTLDAVTIRRLRDAAERLAKPQSAVVRDAYTHAEAEDVAEPCSRLTHIRVRELRDHGTARNGSVRQHLLRSPPSHRV